MTCLGRESTRHGMTTGGVSCMVNRLRLNEKSVRDAEPAEGRDYQIFDSEVRGFAVCVYRSGSRAFTIDYRHAGSCG